MSRFIAVAAFAIVLSATSAEAAGKAPFPTAADGTTSITDCAGVSPAWRNECISRARPLTGKDIYTQAEAAGRKAKLEALKAERAAKAKAAAEKVAAAKADAKARRLAVANAPKGLKVAKDGTTSISDCLAAPVKVRNECISRARPLNAQQLAKFVKTQSAAQAVADARKPAPKQVAAPAAPVKAAVAPVKFVGKGFKVAKDGTTDIAECAKANPEFRNECISRSRPVTGKEIYASVKKQ